MAIKGGLVISLLIGIAERKDSISLSDAPSVYLDEPAEVTYTVHPMPHHYRDARMLELNGEYLAKLKHLDMVSRRERVDPKFKTLLQDRDWYLDAVVLSKVVLD